MVRILVLCTGNSCRSQMAEAFLHHQQPDWQVFSAGTYPAAEVHPLAVQVMSEAGIDISHWRPQSVDNYVSQSFDYVITMCDDAHETCPVFSGEVGQRLHMGFSDPARARGTEEEIYAAFREVRDEIREKFGRLINELSG
ncbi:arsenate reductase ArsC [Candidatus Neomarinimicrobiota bacterium]